MEKDISLEESTTYYSSSIEDVSEADLDVVHQESFSNELEDLLVMLPRVDIATLTSTSCIDLVAFLTMTIPFLPMSQLDRLVKAMISLDLLVPAALHPAGYSLAKNLVKQVMILNSNMRGQVINCLARHADELQQSMLGKEVLKTLQGHI